MDKYVCVSKIINAAPINLIGHSIVDRPKYFIELHKLQHYLNDYASSDITIQISEHAYSKIEVGDNLCLPITNYCGTDTNFIDIREGNM